MNQYEFFLSKIKAMSLQGYSDNQLLDEWREWNSIVITYLERELMIALLNDESDKIIDITEKIKYITELDSTIKIGLLE